MMDEMVERLMHVELVLEFKQVEFVLNLLSTMDFAAEMHVQTRYIKMSFHRSCKAEPCELFTNSFSLFQIFTLDPVGIRALYSVSVGIPAVSK